VIRRAAPLLLWLAVVGCRGAPAEVLSLVEPDAGTATDAGSVASTCAEAFAAAPGSPCVELPGGFCARPVGCCAVIAFCASGTLLFERDCSRCVSCSSDLDCATRQWCLPTRDGALCQPCTPPRVLPTCLRPEGNVGRNGCPTGLCLPSNQCARNEDCPAGARCHPGRACVCSGDPRCCVNRCVLDACPLRERIPVGCTIDCGDLPCPTGVCASGACRCERTGWECETYCATPGVPRPC
jgi:hypothetical protein